MARSYQHGGTVMRLSDMTLNYILALDAILILCTVLGTVLLILEQGLYRNRLSEFMALERRRLKYEAEGRLYREAERQRIHARNNATTKGGDYK
jgi:hypothetical protein